MNRTFNRLPLVLAMSLAVAGPALAQSEPNTAEKAWDATKSGTEKAWDATKSGTEKGWDATKRGTKKAADATGKAVTGAGDAAITGTRNAGNKIGEKIPGTEQNEAVKKKP
ncbi:hypothetical protein ACIPRI_11855 [Variovorax sp. LARHSF232]